MGLFDEVYLLSLTFIFIGTLAVLFCVSSLSKSSPRFRAFLQTETAKKIIKTAALCVTLSFILIFAAGNISYYLKKSSTPATEQEKQTPSALLPPRSVPASLDPNTPAGAAAERKKKESSTPAEAAKSNEEEEASDPVMDEATALAALREKADRSAIGCAEKLVSSDLRDPSSAVFSDQEILDKDDYLRYIVKLTVNATNALGGRATKTYVCSFRIYSEDTGRFTYSNYTGVMEYNDITGSYRPEDWNVKPDDFVIPTGENQDKVRVSIQDLLLHPGDYAGKYVVITDDLYIVSNNIPKRRFWVWIITGTDRYGGYATDSTFGLNIYHEYADKSDEYALISERTAIRAEGTFRLYRNIDNEGYLEAAKITVK